MFNSINKTLAAQVSSSPDEKVNSASFQLAMGKSALEKGDLSRALHLFNLAALPRHVDIQSPTNEQSRAEAERLSEVVKNKIASLEIQKIANNTNTKVPKPL